LPLGTSRIERTSGPESRREIEDTEASIRERIGKSSFGLFDTGDEVTVQDGEEGICFLLVSEKPFREPIAAVWTDRDKRARRASRELREC